MKKITSLKTLLEQLPHCDHKAYVQIAKQLDIPFEDFKPYMHWEKAHYTRNAIVRTASYELILLCWEQGHKTPVHCHGGEECWVLVLDGSIAEERYFQDSKTGCLDLDHKMEMSRGTISYMNDDMGFHALVNTSEHRSMSLHLYVNPIDSCRVFDQNKSTFVQKKLSYHSYEGRLVGAFN